MTDDLKSKPRHDLYPACEFGEHEKCAGYNYTGRSESVCDCLCHHNIDWEKIKKIFHNFTNKDGKWERIK